MSSVIKSKQYKNVKSNSSQPLAASTVSEAIRISLTQKLNEIRNDNKKKDESLNE